MELHRLYLTVPWAFLFITLFSHVTYAYILLTPRGSKFENKNNFTMLDIDDDANYDLASDDLIAAFPETQVLDDSLRTYYTSGNEIVTLTHDTRLPEHVSSSIRSPDLRHSTFSFGKNRNTSLNEMDEEKIRGFKNYRDNWDESSGFSRNPSTPTQKNQWQMNSKTQKRIDKFPMIFERQEVIKMPEPLPPTGRSSLGSRQESRPRTKRRALPSLIVRVPPSHRFLRPGIQTYIRSSRQARVDAQVGVLVVVDHSVYLHYMKTSGNNHGLAVARLRRYYGMVFAMVNERFNTIKDPHLSIKVAISGLLIAEKRADSPWTERIVNWATKAVHGRGSVDTVKSLSGFSQWLNGREGLPQFDHAMVFTAYRLTDPYGVGLGGMAYLEAVCDTDTGNAVSIVGDKGDFQSVRVATHELAHSLGAVHDGESGAEACPETDAFIMSSMTTHNQHAPLQNAFYFSKCSIRDMIKHLSKSRSSCVKDTPPVYYSFGVDRFPSYTPDTQCQLIFGPRSKFCGNDNLASVVCGQLWCRDPNINNGCRTNSFLTALPGTKCANNGACSLGECKPDPKRQVKPSTTTSRTILRPLARIGGFRRQPAKNVGDRGIVSYERGTSGGRGRPNYESRPTPRSEPPTQDRTVVRGTPTSRIETVSKDRVLNGGTVINRNYGLSSGSNSRNERKGAITRNNDSTNFRLGNSNVNTVLDRSRNVNRDRDIDRTRGRIIDRNMIHNSDTRTNGHNTDNRIIGSNNRGTSNRAGIVHRGSSYDHRKTINNRYSTFHKDSNTHKGSTMSRNNAYNNGNTIGRDGARRDNTYRDRGNPVTRGNNIYNRSRTTSRDNVLSRDNTHGNRRGSITRENAHNRGSTLSKDGNLSRGHSYNWGSTVNKIGIVSRGSTYTGDSTVNRGSVTNNGNRPIDRNIQEVIDSRVRNTVSSNRDNNRDSRTYYRDHRITKDRNIHRVRNTNSDSDLARDGRVYRGNELSPDSRIDRDSRIENQLSRDNGINNVDDRRNVDYSKTRAINRGSNGPDKSPSEVRNVSARKRTNSIPKTRKSSRTNRRTRKSRRRRNRSRNKVRSGLRRSGRRQRKKNRGKKKNRCREDKNVTYCQDLIQLNPEGCRRKAIRQYCCATCRRWRKSKRKMSG